MDFLNNPLVLTALRLSHIFFGILWVGFGVVSAFVLHPLAKSMGEKGHAMLRVFYAYSNYNKIFPIAAIVTTAAGLIMWPARVDGMDFIGFSGTGDIIMIIGALIGLVAFGHGAGATGRFGGEYAKAAKAFEETESPSEEQASELATLRAKLFLHSNISGILTIIAAVAMASARYL